MKKKEKSYFLVGASLILLYWVVNHFPIVVRGFGVVIDLLFPFLLGGVIAFILNVPMTQMERHLFQKTVGSRGQKLRRITSYLFTLILVIILLNLIILVVAPEIISTGKILMEQIPRGLESLLNWMEKKGVLTPEIWQQLNQSISLTRFDWESVISTAGSFLSKGTAGLISGGITAVTGIVSGVTSFFIGFVFSVYLLFEKEHLAKQATNLLYAIIPVRFADKILNILKLTHTTFVSFISGQCLEAVILGTMFWLSMLLFRLPYALLVGVVIAVSALIPIVGAFIGCGIGVFLIAMVNPMQALFFLILFLVLQQVEGNLIYPHVVGNAVGLPSIWVLAAVSIGGSLFGVLGMLTFIPLASVFYALLRDYVRARTRARLNTDTPASAHQTSDSPENNSNTREESK